MKKKYEPHATAQRRHERTRIFLRINASKGLNERIQMMETQLYEPLAPKRTRRQEFWRLFRKNKLAIMGMILFVLFFFIYNSGTVGIMNSIDGPQYALTRSLYEDKSLTIDKYTDYISPD